MFSLLLSFETRDTILALKAPWYLIGDRYRFVGGWAVSIAKKRGGASAAGVIASRIIPKPVGYLLLPVRRRS